MPLIKDIAVENPENTLGLAQQSDWFGYRAEKLNTYQTDLLTDFEIEGTSPDCVTWLPGAPIVQIQPATLHIANSEWKTPEAVTWFVYGGKGYQWQTNKVGDTVRAGYSVGAQISASNTGAVNLVSMLGENFSIGYAVRGTLIGKIQLPRSLEERFKQISQLPVKWDSYSACRISGRAIEKAKSLLNYVGIQCGMGMLEETFIAPCSDGGIQLEWKPDLEKELVAKILPSGEKTTFLLTEPSGKEKEGIIKGLEDWYGLLGAVCSKRKSLR